MFDPIAYEKSRTARQDSKRVRAGKLQQLAALNVDSNGRPTSTTAAVPPPVPVVEVSAVPGRPAVNPLQGTPDDGTPAVETRTAKAGRLLDLADALNSQATRQPNA